MRVLLVEDMDMNVLLAESMFDTFFHLRVDVARDGLEAVEKAVDGAYDIIFMDIQMPHMDGITATKRSGKWGKDPHQRYDRRCLLRQHGKGHEGRHG